MRINYFLVLLAILLTANGIAQNIPSYVPKDSLVGYWPFNGNANDESGKGNHGTVNGATLTSDRNGKASSAYYFNNSSYISIKNITSLNKTTNFSISVWEQINANTLYSQFLVSRGWDQKTGHFHINYDIDSLKFTAQINQNWNIGSGQKNISSNKITIPQTDWKNIIATYDGVFFKLYINGILEKSINFSKSLEASNDSIFFGKHGIYANYFLKGKLDEIGIWSRALNQQEITSLYYEKPQCNMSNIFITPQGKTTFCQGDFVNLNASTGVNYKYEWYKDKQLINGATTSVYQAITSGNYSVKVIDDVCNSTSFATTVIVNQYPSTGVSIYGNTSLCEGNSVVLSAEGIGSYFWSNGSSSKSITVNQSGNYSVSITSNGCVTNSNQTTITLLPNPTAKITPLGNTTFCQGGFVNLIATGGSSYKWNEGSSDPSISVSQTNTYTVTVFNSFGCKATASQSVIVNPLPNVTMNVLNLFTLKNASPVQLVATPAGGNFSGNGVQNNTFIPANVNLGKKTITYTYTSPQGCSAAISCSTIVTDTLGNVCSTYDTLKIKLKLTTGIKANQYTDIQVYPNPTSDLLILTVSDVIALNGYTFKIYEIQGKEVYSSNITNTKTEISLKALGAKGMYVLHILDATKTSIQTKKIVLE